MEFVWQPMFNRLDDSVQIFSSAHYAMYWAPQNFGFDTLDTDDPFVVDQKLMTCDAPAKT